MLNDQAAQQGGEGTTHLQGLHRDVPVRMKPLEKSLLPFHSFLSLSKCDKSVLWALSRALMGPQIPGSSWLWTPSLPFSLLSLSHLCWYYFWNIYVIFPNKIVLPPSHTVWKFPYFLTRTLLELVYIVLLLAQFPSRPLSHKHPVWQWISGTIATTWFSLLTFEGYFWT